VVALALVLVLVLVLAVALVLVLAFGAGAAWRKVASRRWLWRAVHAAKDQSRTNN
jgi:hypothetical protein